MLLKLKKVFQEENETLSKSFEFSMSDVCIDGVYPFKTPIKVKAEAHNRASLVNLNIDAEFDFSKPCDRCCEEITRHMLYHFSHRLAVSLNGNAEDEDYIEAPNFELEIDELVRADIILELPGKYLCREDCKGLCLKCGHNLNDGDCGCDTAFIDPRLEKLKQLLD